jgi:hypothetical protein
VGLPYSGFSSLQVAAASSKAAKWWPLRKLEQPSPRLRTSLSGTQKITKWVLDESGLGATWVDDFIYAISGPEDINKIITAAEPANALLMASRIRQAWLSTKQVKEDAAGLKRKGS